MKINHIRWIAVVGLIAIVELQYVWLVNTYKLTKESVQVKSNEIFRDAALEEVFYRMKRWGQEHGDTATSMRVNLDAGLEKDTLRGDMLKNNASGWLMANLHVAFQEAFLKKFKQDVQLPVLDSIYAHILDSVGIRAQVRSCVVDSTGRVLRPSYTGDFPSRSLLKTERVPIDFHGQRFLQGAIVNPYGVIFQRMTLLLIATVLIMVLVIGCIVWQIRIIIRQDKIARLREDFSYAMIHDMKTPLSSILMGTQILETGRLDGQPEKKARYFRILKEEGEHLLHLTNKVLTLSKLENHQLKLQKTSCNLKRMLENLADKYMAKAVKPIHYTWHLEEETVYADEEFLEEALSNLIDNAVKYSGREVEIGFASGRMPDDTVYVKVRDNGFGIPLKDQSRIFEKYERSYAATQTRTGGATGFGLGLNYVFRVAEAHGGRVTVESIEGEYSEFTLYLPPPTSGTGKEEHGSGV